MIQYIYTGSRVERGGGWRAEQTEKEHYFAYFAYKIKAKRNTLVRLSLVCDPFSL